ncbi:MULTISPECIES: lysine/arginine/ornithine ABC transporter substrate-binding protein [unclassified Mesorhizobium]|uniref:lysine/arginine/ornithine ABC transporter substrate-binding protein n=1 Tax=unclassified Mesorhizobium TaxID=325217 RepID=UPI000FD94BD3|nr:MULTISPECIES: lysine/arginine/ornithine ABC transporter substrate-binding protein [unclassified Mesorhizobium]TGQ42740.1 transporter substrate-binding domain-containing protein [Mesorhizobium sp. M00.F.Ca.ET.216.01.1.1]TIS54021.1 MAG: transporter substrate-binding domain-containing protein [Mesorhizobium sp.]TIS86295.1 MAG: transporter substrate-binding domain-containing protein [Mesorhizobium sp.]TJW14580.1 MAG: transporter substrate-binding domain-containing protein [Mesorhizobium sp.]TJW
MNFRRFAAIAAGWMALALPALAQDAPKAITVATEGAYAPWNFTNADGKLDGLEIDLANDLCARMKIQCTIVAQDWDGLIPSLNVGKFDVIMASMFITDKRLEVIDFTQPYAVDPSGFAVAKDSELGKLADSAQKIKLEDDAAASAAVEKLKPLLKGKVVGVQAATSNLEFLKKYFSDTVEIREYKTTEQHDLDLAAGRIDALFAQQTALAATLAKPEFAQYKIAGPGFLGGVFGKGTGAGLRKNETALKEMFNKAIDEAIADGTIKTLSMKWVKTDVTPVK